MADIDTESWPTKAEAITMTGLSLRTLDRLLESGQIRKAQRRQPGRRSIVVLHPDDVERVRRENLPIPPVRPEIMFASQVPAPVDQGSTPTLPSPVVDFLSGILNAVAPYTGHAQKLWLSLEEAADLSGLSRSYLKSRIREGSLRAVKTRGWKIRRVDLVNMQ